jgi:hypothetical protein
LVLKAKPLFTHLSKALRGMCWKGVNLAGHPYPDILFHPSAVTLRWWLNLDTKAIEATPMESAAKP